MITAGPNPGGLEEAGEVLHVAGSGRAIIRLAGPLPEGQVLCDRRGNRVAKVMELIGPVSAPLASAAPLSERGAGRGGAKVFAPGAPEAGRAKRGRRRRWT